MEDPEEGKQGLNQARKQLEIEREEEWPGAERREASPGQRQEAELRRLAAVLGS
jgi:hypothetical protein